MRVAGGGSDSWIHAVLHRAESGRLHGSLVQLIDREHLVAIYPGVKPRRLAAESAVFRAQSTLGVLQDVDPNVAPVVALPDPKRCMLEALAAASPDTGDSSVGATGEAGSHGGANELENAVTWDIDVETYNSHTRVQYYLDFFQGTARERMAVWLTRMPRYEAMIRDKLREHGVPEDMVYLALIESGFSNSAVSRSRATGMWQFMGTR